jgi:D-sedoheptulose 7-phosphate isomerase
MSESIDDYTKRYLKENLESLSGDYISKGLKALIPVMKKLREGGGTVFLFGNGGSASTASHLVNDISKGTIDDKRRRFRCLALVDSVSTVMAWANDSSYADVFSEQLKNLGSPGDIAIGISGSGNSPNVLKALEEARRMKMTTVGLIGMGGGKMKSLCDISIVVPSNNMQHIEDAHMLVGHLIFAYLRDEA